MPLSNDRKRKFQTEKDAARFTTKKPNTALSNVFKAMLQEDAELAVIQKRLHSIRRERVTAERERTRLLEMLKQVDSTVMKLTVNAESECKLEKEKLEKLNDLRFWGNTVLLLDLPNELLELVFLYSGYRCQQRMIRVCRRWKHVLTCELSQLYVDPETLLNVKLDKRYDQRKGFRAMSDRFLHPSAFSPQPEWKYRNPTVRQITFNGLQTLDIAEAAPCVSAWANRYPNLTQLTFTQVLLNSATTLPLAEWMAKRPDVRVTISQALVPAMPRDFRTNLQCKKLIGCRYDGYVRVPDLVLTSAKEYERALEQVLWPYPDDQTAWLARHAHTIDAQLIDSVFRRLEYYWFSSVKNKLCGEHKTLCQHLDGAYYKANMDGQVKNLLAVLVLDRKIPLIKPPVPLRWERFRMVKGHRRLVPKFLK